MEIRNIFLDGNLDISVESTLIKQEGEPLYHLLINNECYAISRDKWIQLKDFIDNALDFIDDNN